VEYELAQLYESHGIGTAVYSPLAGGYLTGKYLDSIPDDSRYKVKMPKYLPGFVKPCNDKYASGDKPEKIRDLQKLAKEIGCSTTALALAWVL